MDSANNGSKPRQWDESGSYHVCGAGMKVDSVARGSVFWSKTEIDLPKVILYLKMLFGQTTIEDALLADKFRQLLLGDWCTQSSIGHRATEAGYQLGPWAEQNIFRLERYVQGEKLDPEEYGQLSKFLGEVSLALFENRPKGLPTSIQN